jgi:hypothetical protein
MFFNWGQPVVEERATDTPDDDEAADPTKVVDDGMHEPLANVEVKASMVDPPTTTEQQQPLIVTMMENSSSSSKRPVDVLPSSLGVLSSALTASSTTKTAVADNANSANTDVPLTSIQLVHFQHLMEEVETVNKEVMMLRTKLYEAQDMVKDRDETVRTLENHVNELLEQRDRDDTMISMLKENNTKLVEEEAKVLESLDLMKKVFTRAQLKAKADMEAISILKEERDAIQTQLTDVQGKETQKSLFDAKAAVQRVKAAADEREHQLQTLLYDSQREMENWKKRSSVADRTVKNLREQLGAMKHPDMATRQLKKQRELIDQLEQQINELEMDEVQREIELRDDDLIQSNDAIVHRAFFDEDLDFSVTRKFIRKIDCTGRRHYE